MTRSPIRRASFFAAFVLSVPGFLLGCPKKAPPPGVDAGEPAPAASVTVTELAPLTEDEAGADAAPEAGPRKWTGTGTASNPNQIKIAACCNAMRAQAKQMGASPEAFQLNAVASQCDMFAKQVGPTGNAPELNQARAVLRSLKLPAACSF
jgi:hypothetical protein